MFYKPIEKRVVPTVRRSAPSSDTVDLFVPVDQYDAKEFNRNDAGWTRNSIAQIARAQSMDEYNAIASRLVECKSNNNIPDGVTVEQAFDMIKPRWAQSANEVAEFIEYTNPSVMARLDDAYAKAVKVVKSSDTPISEPEPTK